MPVGVGCPRTAFSSALPLRDAAVRQHASRIWRRRARHHASMGADAGRWLLIAACRRPMAPGTSAAAVAAVATASSQPAGPSAKNILQSAIYNLQRHARVLPQPPAAILVYVYALSRAWCCRLPHPACQPARARRPLRPRPRPRPDHLSLDRETLARHTPARSHATSCCTLPSPSPWRAPPGLSWPPPSEREGCG